MGLIGNTNEEKIWNFLYSKLKNSYGVAGLIGNLKAESGLNPKNLQNTGNTKLGMTDDEYTNAVDNGTYTNFIRDSQGFGICQWTYWSRKQNLLNYAKACGCSIGDLEMQLNFLVHELQTSYKTVWNKLLSSTSVRQASDVVLTEFEKPANQSESVKVTRAKYGQESYDKFAGTKENNKEVKPMSSTNSPLVTYTKISPNKTSPRNHKIDTITIHCIVGQWTAQKGCDYFSNSSVKASANYIVGKDGSIGLSVEEKDRSWCSSNATNDHRAITIEVASDTTSPYAVTDKALNGLIELCTDICKRNNIKKLVWSTNKNDRVNHLNGCNMTVHRDFANKACPGEYLYERHGYIANEVNKRLGVETSSVSSNTAFFVHNSLNYSLVFDPTYYSNKYSDLKKVFGSDANKLFNHFLNYGMKEGRMGSANFNVQVYKDRYADLEKAYGNNLKKYYEYYK